MRDRPTDAAISTVGMNRNVGSKVLNPAQPGAAAAIESRAIVDHDCWSYVITSLASEQLWNRR